MSQHRPLPKRGILVLLSLAVGCTQSPPVPLVDTARRDTTWQYWQDLLKVAKKVNALEKDPRLKPPDSQDESMKPDAAIRYCRKGATAFELCSEELRGSIRELEGQPLLGVDSEVLEIGSLSLERLRETRSLCNDGAPLFRETASLVEDGNSWGTMFEVILTGDKRISERQRRCQKNWETFAERVSELSRKGKKIDSEIRRVRIALTQRYNKDFPDLD